MATLIDTISLISSTIDGLIDFTVNDTELSKDFEGFLTRNNINLERSAEVQNCLISYILDEKMENYKYVLDYILKTNGHSFNLEILKALKESYISVFKIKKILKNAYMAECLNSEKEYELIPLVKMTNLRSIGLYDYIKARMVKIGDVYYLLEIFDCFGEIRKFNAYAETVKCLIKYPKSQVLHNNEKQKEIKETVEKFYEKFTKIFGGEEIITSNTLADEFLVDFNQILETEETISNISKEKYSIKETDFVTGYFEMETNLEEDFMKNAVGGFKDSKQPYNIGFFTDKDSGLYIVPFLGTVNEILKQGTFKNIENGKECLKNFILSERVSPNLLIKKAEEFKNFINMVNEAFDKNFKDIREIISNFKEDWLTSAQFSPAIVLYNSRTFEKIIGMEK